MDYIILPSLGALGTKWLSEYIFQENELNKDLFTQIEQC